MSQKSVETVIGRLATDEELRARFREAAERTLHELTEQGLALTRTERAALLACGHRCVEAVAEVLDPRLQRACLRPDRADGEPGTVEAG
jgi:hypothetical protein